MSKRPKKPKEWHEEGIFTILIPSLPPTDNHAYTQRGHWRRRTDAAKSWEEITQYLARSLWHKPTFKGPLKARVGVCIKYMRDTQGGLKILFDALEGIVYENDNQISEIEVYRFKEENVSPKVLLTISPAKGITYDEFLGSIRREMGYTECDQSDN